MPATRRINKKVSATNKKMDASGKSFNNFFPDASKEEIKFKHIDKQIINTDLSTWGKQFEAAIKAGHIPEGDLFS